MIRSNSQLTDLLRTWVLLLLTAAAVIPSRAHAAQAPRAFMPGKWDVESARRSRERKARVLEGMHSSIPQHLLHSFYPPPAQWHWFHEASTCQSCAGGPAAF